MIDAGKVMLDKKKKKKKAHVAVMKQYMRKVYIFSEFSNIPNHSFCNQSFHHGNFEVGVKSLNVT